MSMCTVNYKQQNLLNKYWITLKGVRIMIRCHFSLINPKHIDKLTQCVEMYLRGDITPFHSLNKAAFQI